MKSMLNTFTTLTSSAMAAGAYGAAMDTAQADAFALGSASAAAAREEAPAHEVVAFGLAPYERASTKPPLEKGADAYFSTAHVKRLKAHAFLGVEDLPPEVIESENEALRPRPPVDGQEELTIITYDIPPEKIPDNAPLDTPRGVIIIEMAGKKAKSDGPRGVAIIEAAVEKAAPGPFGRASKALEGKIAGESERALLQFTAVHPELAKGFFRQVWALGDKVHEIHFSADMASPDNVDLATLIGKDRAFVASLVTDGVLEIEPAGLRTKLAFDELLGMLEGENAAIIASDPEVGDLALFHALWRARVAIYKIQHVNAVVRNGAVQDERIQAASEDAKRSLAYAREFLEALRDRFPFDMTNTRRMYKAKLEIAVVLFKQGNLPAVDATLVSLTQRLEEDCLRQEEDRIRQERRGAPRAGGSLLRERIRHLAARRYLIKFAPDGTWTIPQGGFRAQGPVRMRGMIAHHVAEDAVVRRTQHQLDRITEEVGVNAHYASSLRGLAESFKVEGTHLAQAQEALAETFSAYEHALATPKVKTRLLVDLTLELAKVAALVAEIPEMSGSQRRLVGFSGSMLRIAARQLDARNEVLARQLSRLAAKQRIEEAVIAERLSRDADLRAAAEMVKQGMMNDAVADLPEELGKLRMIAVGAHRQIQNGKLEKGIKLTKDALQQIISLLEEMQELSVTKNATLIDRERLDRMRTIQKRDLEAGRRVFLEGRELTLETLPSEYVAYERRKIVRLEKLSRALLARRREVLEKTFMALHGVGHKFSEACLGEEAKVELERIKKAIAARQPFVTVVGRQRNGDPREQLVIFGSIPRADAEKLKLDFVEEEVASANETTAPSSAGAAAPWEEPTAEELEVLQEVAGELRALREAASAQGLPRGDRELIACPRCGLQEKVTAEGLITVRASEPGVDTGLRFSKSDAGEGTHRCPACKETFAFPKAQTN